jgi:hypothetical protein
MEGTDNNAITRFAEEDDDRRPGRRFLPQPPYDMEEEPTVVPRVITGETRNEWLLQAAGS